MKRVLLDTNLYVDWLNGGHHQDLFVGTGLVRYLSAIVVMEIRVGAKTRAASKALDQLVRPYVKSGRLLTPSYKRYDEAGTILKALHGMGREVRRAAMVNDVLIALTARAIGASLYTRDRKDFAVIEELSGADVTFVGTT